MMNSLAPRLLSWGMTFSGIGIGLIVASFVGEDTPTLAFVGTGMVAGGIVMLATRYLFGRSAGGQ